MNLNKQRLCAAHSAHSAYKKHAESHSLSSFHIRCCIDSHDQERHSEYQQLRAAIFIQQLKWDIPMDEEGREKDHYDQCENPAIGVHCVYGIHDGHEYLLGGVRTFALNSWWDSMTAKEFRAVGMIPDDVLASLENQYDHREVLELTRFCVQRRRWYTPPSVSIDVRFNCAVARDLTYAAVYYQAEQTNRWKALALVDSGYLQVMERSHFVFQIVYTQDPGVRSGYALTIIDLSATIQAICAAGDIARAERMMSLCDTPWRAGEGSTNPYLL